MFVFIPLPDIPGQTTTVRRAFSISPDGQHVSGTFQDGATPPQAYWWTAVPTPPTQVNTWTYQHGLVAGLGASGRGTNDLGDLVGFYVPPGRKNTPFFGNGGGAAAADFSFDDADPAYESAAFGIDNARNVVGHFCLKDGNVSDPSYPTGVSVGFVVNALAPDAKSHPVLIKDTWSGGGPKGLTVFGLNAFGDLVGTLDPNVGFVLLHPNTAAARFVNVGADPWFTTRQSTKLVVAGINSWLSFVGWFTAPDGDHGVVGQLDSTGTVVSLQQVDYVAPGDTASPGTRLAGISEDGRIVGTYGKTVPFLCLTVPPTIQELRARIRAASAYQTVSAAVAAGAGGWVQPIGRPPHGVDPVVPWWTATPQTSADFLFAAYRLASRIADASLRERMMRTLLDQLSHEIRTLADGG